MFDKIVYFKNGTHRENFTEYLLLKANLSKPNETKIEIDKALKPFKDDRYTLILDLPDYPIVCYKYNKIGISYYRNTGNSDYFVIEISAEQGALTCEFLKFLPTVLSRQFLEASINLGDNSSPSKDLLEFVSAIFHVLFLVSLGTNQEDIEIALNNKFNNK